MNVTLFDKNTDLCAIWKQEFNKYPDVSIINCELGMLAYYDYLVTPGNSLAAMSDGMDLEIRNILGYSFQDFIQIEMLKSYPYGIPIGNVLTFSISKHDRFKHIIYAPIVRSFHEPIRILDIVYVMSIIIGLTLENPKKTFAIPGFGSGCGQIPPILVAKAMRVGYDAAKSIKKSI